MVLEGARVLETAEQDRVEARVADQLRPSLPSGFTAWPAPSQSLASPPPTFPLPMIVMFIVASNVER
jgi:hypothetical protein